MAVKLHGVCVSECNLYYSGSIVLPREMYEDTGLRENDQVSVYNFNSGTRYDTYVIGGSAGVVSVNGPSARLSKPRDRLAIVQYVLTDELLEPRILFLDASNRIVDQQDVFPEVNCP
jgi:aspartate 1-decarboxylase